MSYRRGWSHVLHATLDPYLHIAALQLELGNILFNQELDEFFQFFLVHGLRWDCFLFLWRQIQRPGTAPGLKSRIASLQIVMSSLLVGARTSHPPSFTTTISSMRTPPLPAMYTPGSTVITIPGQSMSVCPDAMRGGS